MIEDLDWNCGLWIRIGSGDWDLVLGLGIGIVDWDCGLWIRIGIRDRDSELGLGIRIGD